MIGIGVGAIVLYGAIAHYNEKSTNEETAQEIIALIRDERSIFKAKQILEENGFSPSPIVDPTGSGERLLMSVDVGDKYVIDTLSYASDTDLAPWRTEIISHVRIQAEIDGTITEYTPR